MADVISNVIPRPFDEQGVLPENYVQNEQRVLEDRNVRAIRPEGGAFFVDTFVLYDANHTVVSPSKYSFDLFSPTITEKIGRTVAGVAILTDASVPSPVYIDYRCVGGPWASSNEAAVALFYQLQQNNRPAHWKNILGKPNEFKPAHHLQDIGDLYGAEYIVAALDRNTQAFLMGDAASHDEIFRAIDDLSDSSGNSAAIDQKLDDLNQQLGSYIDQRDRYVLDQLQSAVSNINSKFVPINDHLSLLDQQNTQVTSRLTALDQQVAQLAQTGNQGLLALRQDLNNHIGTTNAHGVSLSSLGGYTKLEVDQLVSSTNIDLSGYVKKNTQEDLSLSLSNGQLRAWVNGAWKVVWPAQWSE